MRRATKWMWVHFHAHTTSLKSPRLSSLAVCLEERTYFCCKTRVTLEKSTVKVPARERERAPFPQTQRHFCLSTLSTWPKKANLAVKSRNNGLCQDMCLTYNINIVAGVHNSMFSYGAGGKKVVAQDSHIHWCIVGLQKFEKEVNSLFLSFVPKKKSNFK